MKRIMQFMMAVAVLGLIAFNTGVDIENNNDTALTLESLKVANANPALEEGGGGGGGGACSSSGCSYNPGTICYYTAFPSGHSIPCYNRYP